MDLGSGAGSGLGSGSGWGFGAGSGVGSTSVVGRAGWISGKLILSAPSPGHLPRACPRRGELHDAPPSSLITMTQGVHTQTRLASPSSPLGTEGEARFFAPIIPYPSLPVHAASFPS